MADAADDDACTVLLGRARYLCVLLGVLPWQPRRGHGRTHGLSRTGLAFSLLNLLALAALAGCCFYQLRLSTPPVSGSAILDVSCFAYSILMAPAIILAVLLKGHRFSAFAMRLLELDRAFFAMPDLRRTRTYEREVLAGIVLSYSGLLGYTGMRFSAYVQMPAVCLVTVAWTRYVIYVLQCQFVFALVALRSRYERLNRLLVPPPDFVSVKDGRRLSALFDLYETLHSVGTLLVGVSSLFNVLYVLDVFINSVYSMVIIFRLHWSLELRIPMQAEVMLLLLCVVTQVNMAVVMMYCQMTTAESQRTALYAHKSFNMCCSTWQKWELMLLSKQLIGRKIEFTACGMFCLDYSLLYTMLKAVSIYLVTFMQFQLKQ